MGLWTSVKKLWQRWKDWRLVQFLKKLDKDEKFLVGYYILQQLPEKERKRYLIFFSTRQIEDELMFRELQEMIEYGR